jgi:hypothetical protein
MLRPGILTLQPGRLEVGTILSRGMAGAYETIEATGSKEVD